MQRVGQVIEVKNAAAKVEQFENEREERNTCKHHVWQIVEQRGHEQLGVGSMLAYLFFDPLLNPVFRRTGPVLEWDLT